MTIEADLGGTQGAVSGPGGSASGATTVASGPPTVPAFVIVPRGGLIAAAVVLSGLVVAIALDSRWPLEFFHVAFGAAWTIVDLFVGLVIGPILGRLQVQSRIDFTTRFMPKMVVLMPVLVTTTMVAGWQLSTLMGTNLAGYPDHGWLVASFIVVGVMAILALGLLEPANIAVLMELKKPQPDGQVIETLMKRFVYCSGILGVMQIATLVIMTKLAS